MHSGTEEDSADPDSQNPHNYSAQMHESGNREEQRANSKDRDVDFNSSHNIGEKDNSNLAKYDHIIEETRSSQNNTNNTNNHINTDVDEIYSYSTNTQMASDNGLQKSTNLPSTQGQCDDVSYGISTDSAGSNTSKENEVLTESVPNAGEVSREHDDTFSTIQVNKSFNLHEDENNDILGDKNSNLEMQESGGRLWKMAQDEAKNILNREVSRPPRAPSTGRSYCKTGTRAQKYFSGRDDQAKDNISYSGKSSRFTSRKDVEMKTKGGSLLNTVLERESDEYQVPTSIGRGGVYSTIDSVHNEKSSDLGFGDDYSHMVDNKDDTMSVASRADTLNAISRLEEMNSALPMAKRRVKVVRMFVIGLIGLFGGLMGSIYVQLSCHFATGYANVGMNDEEFSLHAGLWKYSPIDSVFMGYSYCSPYNSNNSSNPPIISRIFGLIALVVGTYSLIVLWFYLIMIRTSATYWSFAVRMALIASICQALTLLFYRGDFCANHQCGMGPGSLITFLSSISWLCLGYDMSHNSPILAMVTLKKKNLFEETAVLCGVEGFLERLGCIKKNNVGVPTLSTVAKAHQQTPSIGRAASYNLENGSRISSYRAPSFSSDYV
mmetsp:Transcript_2739/g.3890  ORF Transcript_2739/g.3890 Transcript_2739/m.3890 type:complete len:607 (+) Transcript_2739:68-1888(+)